MMDQNLTAKQSGIKKYLYFALNQTLKQFKNEKKFTEEKSVLEYI